MTILCVTTLPWLKDLGRTDIRDHHSLSLYLTVGWALLCGWSLGVSLHRRFAVPSAQLGPRYAAAIAAAPVAGPVSEAPGQFSCRTPAPRALSLFVCAGYKRVLNLSVICFQCQNLVPDEP